MQAAHHIAQVRVTGLKCVPAPDEPVLEYSARAIVTIMKRIDLGNTVAQSNVGCTLRFGHNIKEI